jgi:hypothetical protein
MKDYRQFLKELPSKKVVFAFGRFNPPTTGHELLVKAVKKLAADSDHVIYASRSQDSKKNPLPVDRKVYYLQRMFPGTKFVAADESVRTFIEAAKELNKKYKDLVMVAGSDRVPEYKKLLDKYNGKEFKFNSIQVISAGERDPDSDEASGMSATKMREAAKKGDFVTFKRGLPHTLTTVDARRLMNEVREGMGLESIKESIKFTVDQIREKYFHGEIYNVGDIVESDNTVYEIVKRGSNHLLLRNEEGSLISKWLQDVQLTEKEFSKVRKDKDSDLPQKYVTGLSKSTAKARAAHWKDKEKYSDSDPRAYEPAPGDANAKTKPSKYTKKYKELYGEETEELQEMEKQLVFSAADKIKVARIIATTLGVDNAQSNSNAVQLVNQGLRNIRRKPLTKNGYEIVMNMLKTARLAGIDYDEKLIPTQAQAVEEACWNGYKQVGMKKKGDKMVPDCVPEENQIDEISSNLVKKARDAAFEKGKDDQGHRFVKKAYDKDKKESDAAAKKMNEETLEENAAVRNKAEKSGVPYSILKQVYNRGVAAWNSGHRPGTTPQQWGLARVNSYITKGKTYHTADKDLREIVQPDGTTKVGQYEETDYNVKVTHRTAAGETAHKVYKVVKAKDHRHAQNIALNKHTAALDKAGTKFVAATSQVMREEVQIDETVESPVVNTSSDYNIAQSIMRYSDMMKMLGKKPIEKAAGAYQDENFENYPEPEDKETESDMDAIVDPEKTKNDIETGGLLVPPYPIADDNLRRRKVKYHLGEAKDIDTSGPDIAVKDDSDELGDEEDKGYDAFFEEDDLPEDDIDAMVDSLTDDEIVDDAYEDDEFAIVDDETGEELKDEEENKVNEEALMEVLSRMERIRAKQRLRRTKAKRERAEKIALRKYSTTQVVNKRARRLAVKALKKRFTKGRDLNKLSVAEKERLEQRIQRLKPIINRIALKMIPRVRKLEKQRLSHRNFTK